jgi:ribose transport system permease protein
VPGVLIGATLIVLLRNLVNILGIPSQVEYMVIGGAILLGVVADELLGRRAEVAATRPAAQRRTDAKAVKA